MQVFVTDSYTHIAPNVVIHKLRRVRRRTLLQRARAERLSADEIRDLAGSTIAAYVRGWRSRRRPPAFLGERGGERGSASAHARSGAALFGGSPLHGGHDEAAEHHHGVAYWRQRTEAAVGDNYTVAGNWASLMRGAPSWGD